ncbi:bifunctional riboflavin kinase/FAD synthetase [Blastochloris viridis]|uniref:Riboflavin biosynthesis protein n=1 Tax=Blastochloris viridis TaxID=1079 RepID=A0A182D241_BLAVI|nr:bifunctional riboflavin kinase/FAD synthetase [Blastochloris viridis]BAR99586.1 riboflavin kinase [Blastochloris viridis]
MPADLIGAVVAIGNFDGVHRGHRAVIAAAAERARALGRPVVALTFEPHPRAVFAPHVPLFRLTPEPVKLAALQRAGCDAAIVLTFDTALAAITATRFVDEILVARFRIAGAAVGFDFHFGSARGGSPAFLANAGARRGFAVDIVGPLHHAGRAVSSSAIRELLGSGRLEDANDLLGYPWFVIGSVIRGDQRGRTLGYPTANIRLDPACGLAHGIYAVRVDVGGRRYDGVANFGRRPTFDNGAPLLEVFLFDFSGDLYGAELAVTFHARLREERKFADVDALVQQMNADTAAARLALAGDSTGTSLPLPTQG